MGSKRFTKEQLISDLLSMAEHRANLRGFTAATGCRQVVGKGEDKNRAYGEWRMLLDVVDLIDGGHIGK